MKHSICIALFLSVATALGLAQDKKPNILIIFGDDVGYWNISAFNGGLMGYSTPNIDRLAKEGGQLTCYYAQQSCTAGRSAFITGQMPFRTGMSKVGFPAPTSASNPRIRPSPSCSNRWAT